jgi:anti-sigma-K factor RskA
MTQPSPYAPPKSSLTVQQSQVTDEQIAALEVSDTWKKRFSALSLAGGPKMPNLKQLSKAERRQIGAFNILAFLFGPLYYIAKGMWRKALSLFAVCAAVAITVGLVMEHFGYGEFTRALSYGLAAVFAARANIDYYKKMLLNDNGWW